MTRFPVRCIAALALAGCASRSTQTPTPAPAPAVAATRPAAPVPLRYAAGTGRYRYESQAHVEQDLMGQTQSFDLSTGALVTVAVAEAAGHLGVGITIDSLKLSMPAGMPAPDSAELAAARGQTVRIVSSPQGATISLTPPDSASATVQQVVAGFRDFLPQLPAGSPDSGTTWTDSSSMTVPSQGLTLTVHTTRHHRVVGWEDRAGTRALHLATTATYTVSGSGQSQGQELNLTGGGQRTSEAYVSAAGVYLQGSLSDSSLVNANVVSAGMVVPVRSRSRSTFTRLP
jgi:hypothetical protein